MSNDIREKVEVLIKSWEDPDHTTFRMNIAVKELKAALRPSREEIATCLESFVTSYPDDERMINYAIEELRSKE